MLFIRWDYTLECDKAFREVTWYRNCLWHVLSFKRNRYIKPSLRWGFQENFCFDDINQCSTPLTRQIVSEISQTS